jgi:hypothetical protein
MRKVFLDDLPRKKYGNTEVIDWKSGVGCSIDFIYDEIYGVFNILEYQSKGQILKISYLDKQYEIRTPHLIKVKLKTILGKKTSEYKYFIDQRIFDSKTDIVITGYTYKTNLKNKYKAYTFKCNKCGWNNGFIEESALIKGCGCSCCSGRTTVEGINDIPTTDPWMIKFFQGGYDEAKLYSKGSAKRIKPICPNCGNIYKKDKSIGDIYNNRGFGCPCGDGFSYPEKIMYSVLKQLNIDFEYKVVFDWSDKKEYDFIVKDYNIIIETHGGQHYKDAFGISLEKQRLNDDYKKMMAEKNGFKYIEIDCRESNIDFIKESILLSEMNSILDFDLVNWKDADRYALESKLGFVCKLKRENPDISSSEISKIVDVSQSTVQSYLKRGTKLGLCNYDSKLEMSKGTGILLKRAKEVDVFYGDQYIGRFPSITYIHRNCEDILKFKVGRTTIDNARKNGKQYKGYTFKYVE